MSVQRTGRCRNVDLGLEGGFHSGDANLIVAKPAAFERIALRAGSSVLDGLSTRRAGWPVRAPEMPAMCARRRSPKGGSASTTKA